jgi:hypothetical protein
LSEPSALDAPAAPRWLVATCALGLSTFVSLTAAAIHAYPGGTWFDDRTRGHAFWQNFLCDLFHHRALNGADNARSAALATAGTLAMLASIAAFFALIARLERPEGRAARVARWAGACACVAGIAVPLTPSDRYRVAHLSAVLIACAPALAATAAALWVSFHAPVSRWIPRAALATLAFGAIDALMYAVAFGVSARLDGLYVLLPVFQRLATLSLLAWMLATLLEHWRRGRRDAVGSLPRARR